MRIGGAYPFGQGAVPIPLSPGATFNIPAGNYLVTLAGQSVLQYFDPSQLLWRVVGQPSRSIQLNGCDGYNYRLVNMSGVSNGALITNAGSGATNGIGAAATGVTVSWGTAPTGGVAATGYAVVGGSINTTIAITAAGSGFVSPPLLLIDPPPPGGIQATAVVATLTAGAIGAVTVTNAGAGYTSVPNVYVIPNWYTYQGYGVPVNATTPVGGGPPGAVAPIGSTNQSYPPTLPFIQWPPTAGGAQLTVNATLGGSGTVTGIVMTGYGSKYLGTAIPTITITGAGAAAATAIMSFSVTSVTTTAAGAAVSVAPTWISSLGLVAASDGAHNIYGPRPASGTTTLTSTTVDTFVIEDAGFGLQKVPQVGIVPAGGTIWTTIPTGTAVVGGVNNTCLLQPAVQ